MNAAALPLHLLHSDLAARATSWLDAGVLDPADLCVVDSVAARFGEHDALTLIGLACAVRAPRVGHIGVDLVRIAHQIAHDVPTGAGNAVPAAIAWPADPVAWQAQVFASGLVGTATGHAPFVRQQVAPDSHLLMTRRLWCEQERLARALLTMAGAATPAVPALQPDLLPANIARLFGGVADQDGALALTVAAAGPLTVITGGPGSGKTYNIKRLLALLLEAHGSTQPALRIELAAPTGKGAVRMAEAMAEQLEELPVADAVRQRLRALMPRTLHKLLGVRPDGQVGHDAARPLAADVIVVDEVSMVDLALMRRLVEAVPAGARLVLLGDPQQLASVEVGTVLADLVASARSVHAPGSALAERIVRFSGSKRFQDAPTIARIADDLRVADAASLQRATTLLTQPGVVAVPGETDPKRVQWLGASTAGQPSDAQLDALAAPYLDGYVRLLRTALAGHGGWEREHPGLHRCLVDAFAAYRVLAVHRRGPLGVAGLERELTRRIRSQVEGHGLGPQLGFWVGQPLLIVENAYDVGLMNGDVGLVLPTPQGLAAVFPTATAGVPSVRAVGLARLPTHSGALAMTVHKSQGSQFQRVALVLAGRDSPLQTRELVYTAITRARERLDLLGGVDELAAALARPIVRASGLANLLAP
ncbi:MAG: exodeoxyribonuclease V subunit alpha [Myxococcales bacterium]|nr:exodeoxyribonuclease V subunit alpha [Myxococcales bacterium]